MKGGGTMSLFKKGLEKFNKSSWQIKLQLVIALTLTALLLIAIPTAAWFNYQRRIVKMQKIQSPNVLILSAAHREDSMFFNIDGIDADAEKKDGYGNAISGVDGKTEKITHKDYVFCVTGEAVNRFTIQLAYTTNNPFSYRVFAAEELTSEPAKHTGIEPDYVTYSLGNSMASGIPELSGAEYHLDAGSPLYYRIDSRVTEGGSGGEYTGRYLNKASGSNYATQTYHVDTYGGSGSSGYEKVHSGAEPVYWQAENVSAFPLQNNSNRKPFSRHFILRVEWEAGALDNAAKETDIVYITVKATS